MEDEDPVSKRGQRELLCNGITLKLRNTRMARILFCQSTRYNERDIGCLNSDQNERKTFSSSIKRLKKNSFIQKFQI